MKRFLKGILPDSFRNQIRELRRWRLLLRESKLDMRRYGRFATPDDASASDLLRGRQLECQLTKDYHRVEKALALSSPKKPFGADLTRRLDMLIPVAERNFDGRAYLAHATTARAALRLWNAQGIVTDRVSPGGEAEAQLLSLTAPERLFLSRRSIRDFSNESVPRGHIERAMAMAGTTPSVCNRQAWTVHIFQGADDAQRVLQFQNGNGGFGDSVPCVAVVTMDARLFAGIEERNQPWIDGGLFSMNFVLALHGIGLSSCMLNMSVLNSGHDDLRKAIGLADHELIVMMIAIGFAKAGHRVARSPRRALDEIIVWH